MSARLRLQVTRAAETVLRGGHPWLFAESVRAQNRPGQLGELAVIYDRADRFLAIGLFDPDSPLRVRILHRGKPVPIDESWWKTRLQSAVALRSPLFDAQTTGYRWVNGESDGWPGLVLDRYGETLVVKLYTAAWLPHWQSLVSLIQRELKPERLVLRLSRNIQEICRKQFHRADGEIIFGLAPSGPVTFLETGLHFEADVLRGQKTGFFLDQRENRRRVETLASDRDVLNVFSFSGGFSLYAARGGARSVSDVDMSPAALQSGQRNFQLNHFNPAVRSCPHHTIQADAFEWLEQAGARFDLIILDPPSLAKKEVERAGALHAYRRLVRAAVQRLRPGAILVAASCSAHIGSAEFFDLVRSTVRTEAPGARELETTLHPPDHLAAFPEAHYLKAIYVKIPGGASETATPSSV